MFDSNVSNLSVKMGEFNWYPVKQVGDKYLLVAASPLFRGYYSLEPCEFSESKLYQFLNDGFLIMLSNSGVDTNRISNISILSPGQYKLYVQDKLPLCKEFLLQSPKNENRKALAITAEGEEVEVDITATYNVRPCCFVDAQYLESLTRHTPETTESFYEKANQ